MKNFIPLILFSTLIYFCCNKQNGFRGKFYGIWAETNWEYTFYSNNEFKFKSEGHYGFVKSKGYYQKKSDSLFLSFEDNKVAENGKKIFRIKGDSCIVDVNLKYDYCKNKFHYSRIIMFD